MTDWNKVAETLRKHHIGEREIAAPALPPREEAARAVVHVEKAAKPEHIVAWTNDLERKEAALAQAAALLKAYAAGELVRRKPIAELIAECDELEDSRVDVDQLKGAVGGYY